MRELMRRFHHPREERGVSAVFFGLALTLMVGALGLSVDVGNVAYERTRAQHAADSAARQLAYQCARYPTGAACTTLQARATAIARDSIEGGEVVATRDAAAKTVTVTVGKNVRTDLLALIGSPDKDVLAKATAKVGVMQPHEVYNVLPLGVHYCTWKNWSNLAGTASEATRKTTLRTDVLQGVENLLSPITSGLLNTVDTKGLTDQLGTDAVQRCTDGDGNQVLTLNGASWLTGETVVSSVVKGLFGWDAAKCELDVDNDVETFLGGLENSGFMPQGCPSQFGDGKLVAKDKTILLPVFKPKSQLADRLDLKLTACASAFAPARTCAQVPPKIGIEIVGFAPFHVTGWKYPGNPSNVDSSVGCAPIPLQLNLRSLIANVLGIVESLVNLTLGLVGTTVPTNLTASISCNGLQGYFTKSFTKDPRATYGPGGEDLGASYATLTK
jgi:Flp pilus assembly protein TadG